MKMRLWCRRALAVSASFLLVILLCIVPADAVGAKNNGNKNNGNQKSSEKQMNGKSNGKSNGKKKAVSDTTDTQELQTARFMMEDDEDVSDPKKENAIYLPITIHDYAADGMLFEWNEVDFSGSRKFGDTMVNLGNTLGYSLAATDRHSHLNNLTATKIAGTRYTTRGAWNSKVAPDPVTITLPSNVKETIYGGRIRTGMVENTLDADKKPVYTKATVEYLADYMMQTLPEVYENEDGSVNAWYVMGKEMEEFGQKDLPELLREQIGDGSDGKDVLGSFEASKEKKENGALSTVFDIETYTDAAYFFFSDLYRDSTGYGQTVDAYDSIKLAEKVGEDGNTHYYFNSAYTDTAYDRENRIIYNTQSDTILNKYWAFGLQVPTTPFNPIQGLGYGQDTNKYMELVNDTDFLPYYETTNFDMTLESHSKFLYYEDLDLYFTFTGDDDVYVFINGILAMDMGGAHPISKTSIRLNDMAARLGLQDGEAYDFDFFFMERHGASGNLGIETNIKMLEPSMITEEMAFQNDTVVGYGGEVDPNQPVVYQFSLKNDGETAIEELTFEDPKLGVKLTSQEIVLNEYTDYSNLIVTRQLKDGSQDISLTAPTEEQLKNLLSEGLGVGEKLIIYGFHYQIPEEEWEQDSEQKEIFPDTLHTTSKAIGINVEDEKKNLSGIADYKVAKKELIYEEVHYYDWGILGDELSEEEKDPDILVGNDGKYALKDTSEGISIKKEELLKTVIDAGAKIKTDTQESEAGLEIVLCSNTGSTENPNNINPHARVEADGSISYQTDASGKDVVYYQVKCGDKYYGPVSVVIYTYAAADNIYVLDYNLPVELYKDEKAGFTGNDLLSLESLNPKEMEVTFAGISESTSDYGTYEAGEESLTYTMEEFMDGKDEAKVQIQLMEADAKELTPETGVVLTQTITVVPADIVYYEDTFAGLTYISDDGNVWAMYEGFDENGNSTQGEFQSADQEMAYGSDPNYELDHQGTLTKEGDETITLSGDASNDTIHELNVNQTADVMQFSFTGTGFEIISRTTSDAYAVLSVTVTDEKTGEVVSRFPVITESENGDLYQVPIISVKDLPRSKYHVNLRAAKSRSTAGNGVDRILYIDGVRIYHPLKGEEEILYYRSEEQEAVIYEMKELIADGKALLVKPDSENTLIAGTTLIEETDEDGFLFQSIDSVPEYLTYGPNNELYLNGSSGTVLVALSLKETDVSSERTIQVGAHRKSDETFASSGAVTMVWGSDYSAGDAWAHIAEIETGTENYYEIDPGSLMRDTDGSLILYIGTSGSENEDEVLSLTNLKLSGYEAQAIKVISNQ